MIHVERYQTPYGTFGKLTYKDLTLHTLERKWANNQSNISCIPPGEYALVPHKSPKFGQTFAVVDESQGIYVEKTDKGRWGILIHPANLEEELQGCIAVGESLGCVNGKWALLSSKSAFLELMSQLNDKDHYMLKITYQEVI